jgi:hypothetical protein
MFSSLMSSNQIVVCNSCFSIHTIHLNNLFSFMKLPK